MSAGLRTDLAYLPHKGWCARIRARGFPSIGALTIASMLPGVAGNYPAAGAAME
jgi:hypothetical protein